MTRGEFFENVIDWSDLKDVCEEYGCDICDDIYNDDGRDDIIEDRLYDWVRSESWRDVRDYLTCYSTNSYDWWIYDDNYDEWEEAGDGLFEVRKNDVAEWLSENGHFEDEEVCDETEDEDFFGQEEIHDEPEEDAEPDNFDFGEMLSSSAVFIREAEEQLKKKEEEDRQRQAEEMRSESEAAAAFNDFVSGFQI